MQPRSSTSGFCSLSPNLESPNLPESPLSPNLPLPAGNASRSRPLCQYPRVAKCKGTGSTEDTANFVCSSGY